MRSKHSNNNRRRDTVQPHTATTIQALDLQLGDRVHHTNWSGPYGDCIVKRLDAQNHMATMWRIYGHTADFAYTDGVICYVGVEQFSQPLNSEEYFLLERVTLR